MSFIAAAVIGGVGAIAGGVIASRGASKAAGKAADATDYASWVALEEAKMQNEFNEKIYDQTQRDFEPYRELGDYALREFYDFTGMADKTTQATDGLWFGNDYPGNADQDPTAEGAVSGPPELSPLGQWQLQEFNKSQGRADLARGIAGTGTSASRQAEGETQIRGEDWMRRYGMIMDALGIGTNAAAKTGAAGASVMANYANPSAGVGYAQMNSREPILTAQAGNQLGQTVAGLGNIGWDLARARQYNPSMFGGGSNITSALNVGGASGGSSAYGVGGDFLI